MERLTIRVPADLAAVIEEHADADDVSESEAARRLLRRGTEYDDLEQEKEQAEARAADLRRQLQEANAGERDIDHLVTYVEEEKELQHQREVREQQREERRNAPLWRRAKWWVFGWGDGSENS